MDDYDLKALWTEVRTEAYEKSLARHAVASKPESSNNSNSDIQRRKPTDAEVLRWRSYIDNRMDSAIAAALHTQHVAVGKALGAIRAQLREEIATAVGSLRADLYVARAHERREQEHGGEIIDMLEPRIRRG